MEALKRDVEKYPDAYQYERAQRLGVSQRGIGYAWKRLGISRARVGWVEERNPAFYNLCLATKALIGSVFRRGSALRVVPLRRQAELGKPAYQIKFGNEQSHLSQLFSSLNLISSCY
jgi:hypothetical protein